ncbi:MAG: hypothetical protein PWR24_60 [Desulfonauticus sp.]|jgi:hypothetical protein|nr:MAG: hypothetical protein XD41_0083 [Desulfonauticus sp. 38_4375]MDK2920503.1 hypothetical protein [Desulfonauticus sp.]
MIVIDGQKLDLEVKKFNNLEELLVKVMAEEPLKNRVITDVYVNDEAFSEIYPHQAEDIETEEIEKIEIKTVSVDKLAIDITRELYKVINLLLKGGKEVSELFRETNDFEALDMYQDFLQVLRDFMGMIGAIRQELNLIAVPHLEENLEILSDLFTEILDVQKNEDWILLADLIEYELLPHLEEWKKIVSDLREEVKKVAKN